MNAHTKKEEYDDEKRRWDRTQHCTHAKQSGRLARERKKKNRTDNNFALSRKRDPRLVTAS
jgi:hypothetical protein